MKKQLECVPSGIRGLDELLYGGLLKGSAYIIQGVPGVGKTILANQICFYHSSKRGKALYVSLLAESHARMLGFMGKLSFYRDSVIPSKLQYISGYNVLEREGAGGLLKLLHHELKRQKAELMVLDGLFVVESSSTSSADFRRFVHELQGLAASANAVLLLLTHEQTAVGSPEQTMVDGWIELTNRPDEQRNFRLVQVRKHRGLGMISGHHAYKITSEGLEIFPRAETIAQSEIGDETQITYLPTGISKFDNIIGSGLPAGSTTLLMGPSGSGKTTFCLHFATPEAADERTAYITFNEKPQRLLAKADAFGFNLSWRVANGRTLIKWYSPFDSLGDEVVRNLIDSCIDLKVTRVVVDGLGELQNNLTYKSRLPAIVQALSSKLRSLNVAAVFTLEIPGLHYPETLGTDSLSALADNIILTLYKRSAERGRELAVLKLRDGGFRQVTHDFVIAHKGIELIAGEE